MPDRPFQIPPLVDPAARLFRLRGFFNVRGKTVAKLVQLSLSLAHRQRRERPESLVFSAFKRGLANKRRRVQSHQFTPY